MRLDRLAVGVLSVRAPMCARIVAGSDRVDRPIDRLLATGSASCSATPATVCCSPARILGALAPPALPIGPDGEESGDAPSPEPSGVLKSARPRCHTVRVTPRRVAALLLALTLLTAACSDDDGGSGGASGPTSTDEIVDIQDQPGDEEATGARDDVGQLTCEADGEGWRAAAQVTNSTDAVASYRIFVSFLDAEDETLGVTQVDVDGLDPGESEDWEGSLAVTGDDLDCALRVERFEG